MSSSPFEVHDMFNNTYSLPEIIVQSMDNAVPIWQVLGITKEQYDEQYGETEWTKKILQEQNVFATSPSHFPFFYRGVQNGTEKSQKRPRSKSPLFSRNKTC